MKKITLFFLFIGQISFAQPDLLRQTLQAIDLNEDTDTIQAVFTWIADNIRYDVKELAKMKNKKSSEKSSEDYKNLAEKRADIIEHALKYKKGVCEEYASLFDAMVTELGYESHIIEGYTKKSNGNLNRGLGHVWNTVKVNGKWQLYDPTWGAGSVRDGRRFIREYNPKWYEVDPEEMIKTHMPFDPIWQLREPIQYKDFEENLPIKVSANPYNSESLIAQHLQQDEKSRMENQLKRSLQLGEGTNLLKRWRKRLSKSISVYGINSKVDQLNNANDEFNEGAKLFNKFITAQKKQFRGEKYSIQSAEKNLKEAKNLVTSAHNVYKSVEVEDRKGKKSIKDAITHSEKLLSEINRGLSFLAKKK